MKQLFSRYCWDKLKRSLYKHYRLMILVKKHVGRCSCWIYILNSKGKFYWAVYASKFIFRRCLVLLVYQCAYITTDSNEYIRGELFITRNYLCFHETIVQSLSRTLKTYLLPFKDITSINLVSAGRLLSTKNIQIGVDDRDVISFFCVLIFDC